MEREAVEVLRDALALPAESRAALVDSLIESLDPTIDDDAEEAWKMEIGRRLQEIDNGAVELTPWQVARQRLRDRLER
jgi:putative addiction module component (TIGR02574 family)